MVRALTVSRVLKVVDLGAGAALTRLAMWVLIVFAIARPMFADSLPDDLAGLYGNTIELKTEHILEHGRTYPELRWFYFTGDGKHVLTAWHKRNGDPESLFRGVTYGREEKKCIENTPPGKGEHSIICGKLMVRANIVTLLEERRMWDTSRNYAFSDQLETVFSFNGHGECSFIWEERKAIDRDYVSLPGETTIGTCRVIEGRRLDGAEIVLP